MGKSKKKKKNKVQTEQQKLLHEQAVQRRAEKVAAEKRKEKNSKIITFLVFIVMLLISIVIFSVSIGKMYDYETNYKKMDGVITGYKRVHRSDTKTSSFGYILVISYNVGGKKYTFEDSAVFREYVDHLVGNSTKIYVNKENPEKVKKVTTADDLSIISVPFFAVSVIAYCFFAMLCQNYDSTLKKRFLRIWLPIFVVSVLAIFLSWVVMPNSNLVVVLDSIDGSIGYLIIACISVVAMLIDGVCTFNHIVKKNQLANKK